ncbi:MAG TPA: hypothetical protein VGH19_13355 [Verrucomicrobiae bacterium]
METAKHYRNGLRIMADYSNSGVWAICLPGERDPFRHQMITHDTLGIPPELASRFEKWVANCSLWFEWKRGYGVSAFSAEELNAEGRLLASELKQQVGSNCPVFYASIGNPKVDEPIR